MKIESSSTIAVVGASARAAAFSLLRAGFQVITADLFADADLARQCEATRISRYPEGFVDWLATVNCDAWLYTGALENHPTLVDRLADVQTLLGHGGNALQRVRDPMQLQATLTSAGLHFPNTVLATELGRDSSEWLGKTYRGSCGSGVGVTKDAKYFQQRIRGTPLSAVYVGKQLLGVTRQLVGESWTGAGEFQYCGTIATWTLPTELQPQLHKLGNVLCDEFNLTDLYGVDLILADDKLWIIEVNPRYTAAVEVVERARGIAVFNPDIQSDQCPGVGKVILYAKAPFVVTEALSESLLKQANETPWPDVADIPVANTEIELGQPILTLFAIDQSRDKVERCLRKRVAEFEQQLYGKTIPCG